ncbi:unnamed protein product [Rotaria magnacalcarata]|uniref:Uncharacterized protein n=1 Tax=Rotaria magnacalcarata TaxID=392030 RepID=A0A8S2KLA7_9BILA|nr:unnamed protein product [Rotaria magnacalcarata]
MENVVLTSATHISPKSGSPLCSQFVPIVTDEAVTTLTIESSVENPSESVEQTETDGNFQAKMDINYQAHDVALAAAATGKSNEHEQTNGLKLNQHHKVDIDETDQHPDKVKSPCSMVNALLLVLAIVCFAIFLCAIAIILTSKPVSLLKTFFDGLQRYRSVVLKGNHFGSIRLGFDGKTDSMDMNNQLPLNYPLLNSYNEDWSMYGDVNAPYRVRFVHGLIETIYELTSFNPNELIMTTFVSPGLNEQIVADPTNNIYFNLLGDGNLSTHYLTLSGSTPVSIEKGQKMEKNLTQGQFVDQLKEINNYFFKIDQPGIGKNYIATLSESETKTKLTIFADHHGIMIDTSVVTSANTNKTISDIYGIRISPRQSPVYETVSNYGPTLIVYPSQAIHTTWWRFEY